MTTLMVIVFGGIPTVNYILDPGHVYHGHEYIDKVIAGIRTLSVLGPERAMNELNTKAKKEDKTQL